MRLVSYTDKATGTYKAMTVTIDTSSDLAHQGWHAVHPHSLINNARGKVKRYTDKATGQGLRVMRFQAFPGGGIVCSKRCRYLRLVCRALLPCW